MPEAEAVDAGMTVEEGIKFCVSFGLLAPPVVQITAGALPRLQADFVEVESLSK